MLGTNCQFLAQNDIFFAKISLDKTIFILILHHFKVLEYMRIFYIYKKQPNAELISLLILHLAAYNLNFKPLSSHLH